MQILNNHKHDGSVSARLGVQPWYSAINVKAKELEVKDKLLVDQVKQAKDVFHKLCPCLLMLPFLATLVFLLQNSYLCILNPDCSFPTSSLPSPPPTCPLPHPQSRTPLFLL